MSTVESLQSIFGQRLILKKSQVLLSLSHVSQYTLGFPTYTTRACVRTIYVGHNSHTLIFPPTWNYSQFSLSLMAVGSLSQHAFPRLYLSPVIRQQYEPVEMFCTSAFWQPKCEGQCQVLRLSHGGFSRATLSCLFFICSITAMQWRQEQPHAAGEHCQGMILSCAPGTNPQGMLAVIGKKK